MKDEEKILHAVNLLGLPRQASMRQVQTRYRELVKLHHPDRQGLGDNPEMAQINEAYALLMHYCRNYKISFEAGEVHEQPDDWWAQQFGDIL